MKATLQTLQTIGIYLLAVLIVYQAWEPSMWMVVLVALAIGFSIGVSVTMRYVRKRLKEDDQWMSEYLDKKFADLMSEGEIIKEMEKHRDRIELNAMIRLREAFDQCARTGKPVKVEFAGHEEAVWVTPPKGTQGPGREKN